MMKTISQMLLCFAVLYLSAGCSARRHVQTQLYFGLSVSNGSVISDSAWNVFVQTNISHVFPEGFTVTSAQGRWMDLETNKPVSEPSRVVMVVNKMSKQLSNKIDGLRQQYKTLYQQQSVLRVDTRCQFDF